MTQLGNGLSEAGHDEEALSMKEAELSTLRRLGAPKDSILVAQSNLSNTYSEAGRLEQASQMDRDIYYGRVKLNGEENERTLRAAYNYATSLCDLERFEEAKSLLRRSILVAHRVFGETDDTTLRMRTNYAGALIGADGATLDDLREAVMTLEDVVRIARRVLGGSHPLTAQFEEALRRSRAALRAHDTPSTSG